MQVTLSDNSNLLEVLDPGDALPYIKPRMVEHVERWAQLKPASPKGFRDGSKFIRLLLKRSPFSQVVKDESQLTYPCDAYRGYGCIGLGNQYRDARSDPAVVSHGG